MSIEFVKTVSGESVDQDELIGELIDDLRNDLESEADDKLMEFEDRLQSMDNYTLAKEYEDRIGESLRIEEVEDDN